MLRTFNSDVLGTLDLLVKEIEDIDIISLYQDKNHAIELSHKDGVFFVRLDGANLYAGTDGSDATSMYYEQIAQIEDDAERGTDPDFAALREILQARNEHVREMLAAIGHERLAASLSEITFEKEFNISDFKTLIKQKMTTYDTLNAANYRPSEKENEECHTCIFFAAGGFCTKMDLPVKEEMMCDWFKPLPMAEKNEEWSHLSHQPWEEAEHEEEHDHIDGVQKDVSKDLIYTSEDNLESPANKLSDSRQPNLVMREFIPYGAEDGYQILAQNDDHDGIEIQLVKSRGEWQIFTKQRDYSDLGDPFQSVGEPHIPRKIKLREDDDKEGVDKLRDVRGQGGEEIEKIIPALAALAPIAGAVAGGVGQVVGEVANTGAAAAQQMSDTDEKEENEDVEKTLGENIPALKGLGFKSAGERSGRIRGSEVSAEFEKGLLGKPKPDVVVGPRPTPSPPFTAPSTSNPPKIDRNVKPKSDSSGASSAFDKESNEGGVGVDDPEAPNSGLMRHYDRFKEIKEEELALQYPNDSKEVQKPIDPDEDGREALSSAETGTGTQAFSSGAVIDLPPDYKDAIHINSEASGGAGGRGVEGGGDGSASGIIPSDGYVSDPPPSDYDSDLSEKDRTHPSMMKQDGGGGGDGGGSGVGTSGSFGGGTALSVDGGDGDAVYTDTHGRAVRRRNSANADNINGQAGLDKGSLSKDSMDAGSYEGVSQLPYPQDDDTRPLRTVERHKPGDSEEEEGEKRASDQEHEIPMHQQPIGEGYASSYVIADDNDDRADRYSPTQISQKPEHELVGRKFIDEDHRLRSINDNAAEQYTNLSMLSTDLMSHTLGKGDTPESLGEIDAFKVLTENSIQKMDTGRTLVVAGWGNYYIVDREGHRISLDGMRRALVSFLGKKEFANMNIFHSGIQVGQIIRRFVDQDGKEWRTEVRPEGLFVVAAFRTDLEVARKAMAEVLNGGMRGFSIAGNAKSKEIKCEHGKCWTEVNDLEIYEVTLCVTPMNPKSYITDVIQKPDPMLCPECYDVNQLEFDSSLKTRI